MDTKPSQSQGPSKTQSDGETAAIVALIVLNLRGMRESVLALLPIAVILVGRYGGLGIHTLLNALRLTSGYFRGVVFVSVGEVDSGGL